MSTPTSVSAPGVRDNFDAGSLSWVMGEIREALTKSKTALFDAVTQDADAQAISLRHAKSYLHQADGALQIVDIDGVAIITETTEDLFDRIEAGQIVLTTEVAHVIEKAYQALAEYLEELLNGGAHQPVRLFPYYRALLELRSAERIHPADLFFPNRAVRPTLPAPANVDVTINYLQLRKRFELALLPLLKQADAAIAPASVAAPAAPAATVAAAAGLKAIIAEIEQAQANSQSQGFWWVLHGFAEGVAAGQIPLERYVKQLFARINLQIRRLSEGSHSIAERLMRDALFFIARITEPSARAQQIQHAYGLVGLVPADYSSPRYGQIDAALLLQAKEALTQAKTLWNRIANGDASAAEPYEVDIRHLMEIGSKLGSASLSKLLRELNGIARLAAHSRPGDRLGLEMATSLLFVENALNNIGRLDETFSTRADALTARLLSIVAGETPKDDAEWLDDMSRQAQQRQTLNVIATEMQSSLRQVEKTLEEYFRDPADRTALSHIGSILHQIGGALAVLDQDDATLAIAHTRAAVQAFIDAPAGSTPDAAAFTAVAQNIGALSFFIETLQLHPDAVHGRFHFDQEHGIFRANLIEKKLPPEQVDDYPDAAQIVVAGDPVQADFPDILIADVKTAIPSAPVGGVALAETAATAAIEAPAPAPSSAAAPAPAPSSAAEAASASAPAAAPSSAATPLSSQLREAPITVEEEMQQHQQKSADLAHALHAQPDNTALQEQLRASLQQVQRDAKLLDNQDAGERAKAAIDLLAQADFATSPDHIATIVDVTARAAAPAQSAITAAPVAVTTATTPQSDEAVDAELLEIFLIEADEVLTAVRQSIPESRSDPHNPSPLTTLRRSFHTLKGSGRMVGLNALGEAAWSIEQALNLRLSEGHGGSANLYALLDSATDMMTEWVADLQLNGRSNRSPQALVDAAERVMNGEPFRLDQSPSVSAAVAPEADAAHVLAHSGEHVVVSEIDTPPAISIPVPHTIDAIDSIEAFGALSPPDLPGVESTFIVPPLPAHVDLAEAALSFAAPASHAMVAPVPDGSINDTAVPDNRVTQSSAGFGNSITIADEEHHFDDLATHDLLTPAEPQSTVAAPVPATASVIDFPRNGHLANLGNLSISAARTDDNVKRIGDLEISVPLHNIYLAETDELVRLLGQDLAEWRHEPERPVSIQAVHASHSLAGSSATVGFTALQEVAHALENIYQLLARKAVALTPSDYDVLERCVALLKSMLQEFALGDLPLHEPAQINLLVAFLKDIDSRPDPALAHEHVLDQAPDQTGVGADAGDHPKVDTAINFATQVAVSPAITSPTDGGAAEIPESANTVIAAHAASVLQVAAAVQALPDADIDVLSGAGAGDSVQERPVAFAEPVSVKPADGVLDPSLSIKDELDADLLPVFIEEGRDMLPQMGEALRAWQKNLSSASLPQSVLRLLHTIKGSARMAGAMSLGQYMHETETRVEQMLHHGAPNEAALDELLSRHDHGVHLFDALQHPPTATSAPHASVAEFRAAGGATSDVPFDAISAPADAVSVAPFAGQERRNRDRVDIAPTAVAAVGSVALVRVRADIIDRLVNQAGEVSISRSKLETEVGTLRQSLGELTDNVARLREQLREIEMQAETQMTSRMAHSADREFDPLEFDRFTRLQEITRMMAESVSDVASVQQNLARTVNGATIDLAAQARLTRDLQQDLMRVRMVQFASISERLYRVTRQASKEVDKRINLDIRGSAVEIDRSVLEKMAGPFEHLLRNAIVHGIESREQRRAAGKNETGELRVEIRQEGNEVVLQFSDDGGGLDLQRIRHKAEASGLLALGHDVSEAELTDLIFNPGFTTAHEVTELAGRGVGMDVVRSEATALGGRVAISSAVGKGAQFTIHLPLTLAVTQVVVLRTGDKTYAVPSVLVEQVQQLKATALAAAYNDGVVIWQGHRVPLFYLPALLGERDTMPVAQQYSPLIILKSGNDRVAIHVDDILGNREVVVKNIGPQLARMIGIAGATVLGSGEIVLILNPVPLAQRAVIEQARAAANSASQTRLPTGAVAEIEQAQPLMPSTEVVQGLRRQNIVMVVDDSLTVRRVTQRLLSREGYQVVLAKDGVDALQQLQAITPDVMLVDIEMPRMDGFDLTRNVRGDERTRDIPIVMITSRTAEKHRNYAMELGVNEYLGKPFQEDDLLKAIADFIKGKAAHTV